MRAASSLSLVWASLLFLVLLPAAMLSAEGSPPADLSQTSTDELVKRAFEISRQLDPGLTEQLEDWQAQRTETEALRSDLEAQRKEAASLKAELADLKTELQKRSSEASASAKEVSEARAALKRISILIGSSAESWESSIEGVDKAISEAARKQRNAELRAGIAEIVALAAIIWGGVETCKKAGK